MTTQCSMLIGPYGFTPCTCSYAISCAVGLIFSNPSSSRPASLGVATCNRVKLTIFSEKDAGRGWAFSRREHRTILVLRYAIICVAKCVVCVTSTVEKNNWKVLIIDQQHSLRRPVCRFKSAIRSIYEDIFALLSIIPHDFLGVRSRKSEKLSRT